MPYKSEWVPADMFLKYKGIAVYHVYKHNEVDQPVREYHFSLSDDSDDDDDKHGFDVRELSTWTKCHPEMRMENHIKLVICQAIDKGELDHLIPDIDELGG